MPRTRFTPLQSAAKRANRVAGQLDKILRDFKREPVQISPDDVATLEQGFGDWAPTRRLGFRILSMSGKQVIEHVTAEDGSGAEQLKDYAERLRELADMMTSASARITVALCSREKAPPNHAPPLSAASASA